MGKTHLKVKRRPQPGYDETDSGTGNWNDLYEEGETEDRFRKSKLLMASGFCLPIFSVSEFRSLSELNFNFSVGNQCWQCVVLGDIFLHFRV
jgi:hypothetical protein